MGGAGDSAWTDIGIERRAQVMLLGTFHFHNPRLDAVKHEDLLDVLAPSGQAQVAELVGLLCRFRPTKVGVEHMAEAAPAVQAEYDAYRAGDFELTANEIHQVGFRVAARLGHQAVYPIDAKGAIWDGGPWRALEAYAKAHGQEPLLETPARYSRPPHPVGGSETLRQRLLVMNEPERIKAGHAVYFDGPFRVGGGNEYPGVDLITVWWYGRNLRIFANIQRITECADDRILVIIGAGHLPILRHAVECSPDHQLVEVASVLSG